MTGLKWGLVFAVWCSGWVWGLLELTRPYPGVLSGQPHKGSFELLERLTGWPWPAVMCALFLACWSIPALLALLQRWLDREGIASASLQWAFGSRSLNLLATSVLLASVWVGLVGEQVAMGWVMLLLLVVLALPFFAWRPCTLAGHDLQRWWVPAWPGVAVVAVSIVLWTVSMSSGLAVDVLADSSLPRWLCGGAFVLDSLVGWLFGIIAGAIWLNRSRWRTLWRDGSSVLRWSVLRRVVWQNLALLTSFIAFVFPAVLVGLLAIFVIPQYEAWAETSGGSLSPALMVMAQASRGDWGMVGMAALASVLGAYSLLATGRLLWLSEVVDRPGDKSGH